MATYELETGTNQFAWTKSVTSRLLPSCQLGPRQPERQALSQRPLRVQRRAGSDRHLRAARSGLARRHVLVLKPRDA